MFFDIPFNPNHYWVVNIVSESISFQFVGLFVTSWIVSL